jgi:2,5-furandicarboxylate decarboxylase 1
MDDLRQFLSALEEEKQIMRVRKEVDRKWEVSAVIKKAGGMAVFFEHVRGSSIPIVGNLFGNMRKIELALGTSRDKLLGEYRRRVSNPVPPRIVNDGPVKQKIFKGDALDLGALPVPFINELDGGYYIDAGIVIIKDPEFGHNLALHRIQVKGKQKSGILAGPSTHLHTYIRRAWERGKPLEVAVAIGCAPALYIASQVTGPLDLDEYRIAGALNGKPIDVVRCETVDVLVPASAEIVFEGIIPPNTTELEGPFGEFHGYYTPGSTGATGPTQMPVIEYQAMTCRENPIFQMIMIGKPPTEGLYLRSLPHEADLYRIVREVVPEVKDVHFPPGGCGRYHAVVSIRKRTEGDGKLALAAMLSSRIGIKFAIVVDEDIDVRNALDVEWAMATRSQFDRDSVTLNNAPHVIDPSVVKRDGRTTAKFGIDATRPIVSPYPDVCDVPREVLERVEKNWTEYAGT